MCVGDKSIAILFHVDIGYICAKNYLVKAIFQEGLFTAVSLRLMRRRKHEMRNIFYFKTFMFEAVYDSQKQ